MSYLFTSESVSEGHPDKVADQISDAVLDEMLKYDRNSKVACETMVTTGLAVIAGEVNSEAYVDLQTIARDVIRKIGYTKAEYRFDADSCAVISALHEQSADIRQGVDRENEEEQGAGDQGMMFGYATNEMDNYMPLTSELAHDLLYELAKIRREKEVMTYLRPDSKSQVTLEYDDDNNPVRIDTIVISTQHDEFDSDENMQQAIKNDIETHLIPRVKSQYPERIQKLFDHGYKLMVNPTGKFVIGGPHGDSGLTGRKIIVDTYGGHGAHGGGAFSGKDASKVDRSAAYATRHIAKNMVAAGVADRMLVQVAYAIGYDKPVGLFVNTYGTAHAKDDSGNILTDGAIALKIEKLFDLRPFQIVKRYGLKYPIFTRTAAYGHFGRVPFEAEVELFYNDNGSSEYVTEDGNKIYRKKVNFFSWEKVDMVDEIKKEFNL
jgi:S-adenosylmethionine synthetase